MLQFSVLGHSALGNPIQGFHFGASQKHRVLILAGVHGDEVEGVSLALKLIESFMLGALPDGLNALVIPQLNIDGVLQKTRGNGNGVDLNRNLPTRDWTIHWTNPRYQPGPHANSEPENQLLVKLIDDFKPRFIFSLHSWKPMLNVNEIEGSSLCRMVAEAISSHTGAPVEPTIGYSTPGCLGTYAGYERSIPTLTYEIERGMDLSEVIRQHLPATLQGLELLAKELNSEEVIQTNASNPN